MYFENSDVEGSMRYGLSFMASAIVSSGRYRAM